MQYYKPEPPFYVGDCMPFFHEGIFHLYYLWDENHHQAKGGLGAHQWAHATSSDLIHWEHHPIAIPCSEDWEGSICTGSVFHHNGTFYGYYATRMLDRTEQLSLAVSSDGINFKKTDPNPFAAPVRGYSVKHYRDPFVFADEATGDFHMLVTASLEDYPVYGAGGCLAHLTSPDLKNWSVRKPFLIPGGMPGSRAVPECPDYFYWNGWYYLVFSLDGTAHYRMSRQSMGPWLCPPVDTFDGSSLALVMKTASFKENRRIGVAYFGSRREDRDDGQRIYGGNALFREIIQHEDGSLGTKFPHEMVPAYGDQLNLPFSPLTGGATGSAGKICVQAYEGLEAAVIQNVPRNVRLAIQVKPEAKTAVFGIWLRGSGRLEKGYKLHFFPYEQKISLNDQILTSVDFLDQPFRLEIILKDDFIDVCVDDRRCLIDRCPELHGEALFFFCQNGAVVFDSIVIAPIL